ncbi:hypothetical protein FDA94_23950 [Herbidospora galbida]|uniref:DUF5666 domain-containing protein n=1 Tax=Herbidospora galbida TaxID=2575442 RepID=A0A4V6XBD0_9ACTN|nr:hypothetical protein [Herbidospora galbida]TKK85953.1 hypothetical protein FDA94_23950 [Herbidospora galbida]
MKHRRLAVSGLLALAVTFGVTGAANATDDVPTLKPVSGTIACTAGGEGVEIKEGVVTINGKEVTSISVTKAIPAIPAVPGAQAGGEDVASAVPVRPGEAGEPTDVVIAAPDEPGGTGENGGPVTLPARPFDGKPGEPVEFGKVIAAIPAGEAGVKAGVDAAQPAAPEGPTHTTADGPGPSFSSDGSEAPEGAKVVCFASAVPAGSAAPAAPEAPEGD